MRFRYHELTRRPSRRVALAAVAIALAAFGVGWTVAANTNWKFALNPDVGQSDAERAAAHQANSDQFWKHYAAWVQQVGPTLDLRSTRITGLLAVTSDPAASLADAVDRADLVVAGRVQDVTFLPTGGSVHSIVVDNTLKGNAGSIVKVASPCTLEPNGDWSVESISCADGVPMLYPGDQVVLMTRNSGLGDGTVAAEPWTGIYWVVGSNVRPVDGNPFGSSISTMSLDQLLTGVEAVNR